MRPVHHTAHRPAAIDGRGLLDVSGRCPRVCSFSLAADRPILRLSHRPAGSESDRPQELRDAYPAGNANASVDGATRESSTPASRLDSN